MHEQERLRDLREYKILDTPPEKELDELAEIASAICDVPISAITLLDNKRQWFKAILGLDVKEAPREISFCQHALHDPSEVLVVNDPLNDERFKDNPFVQGQPFIRFYAGAPLVTPNGNVLGTLCIIDSKTRKISERQKKALKLLAKKVMDYLETRRLLIKQGDKIEMNARRLKKLTDQAPGAIYQLEMKPNGKMSFPFISKGFSRLHPGLNAKDLKRNGALAFKVIHPDDLDALENSIRESFLNLTDLSIEYRIVSRGNEVTWHWANAKPEKLDNGTVVWYGTFQDITSKKEYVKTLEQMLFDISHVMRRPVTTMLSLAYTIERTYAEERIREYVGYMKTVAEEMDTYIKKMNESYTEIRIKMTKYSDKQTADR